MLSYSLFTALDKILDLPAKTIPLLCLCSAKVQVGLED